MKYFYLILLLLITFQACNNQHEFERNLRKDLSVEFLKTWDDETNKDVKIQNNKRLNEIFKSHEMDKISIFDRALFLKDLEADRRNGEKINYSNLTIVELNLSGERYQRLKYLLGSCNENTSVLRCHLEQGKWIFDPVYIKKTAIINNVINVLNNPVDKSESWLQSMNDILSVTKLKSGGQIEVKVYGTLNEKQLTLLGDINE